MSPVKQVPEVQTSDAATRENDTMNVRPPTTDGDMRQAMQNSNVDLKNWTAKQVPGLQASKTATRSAEAFPKPELSPAERRRPMSRFTTEERAAIAKDVMNHSSVQGALAALAVSVPRLTIKDSGAAGYVSRFTLRDWIQDHAKLDRALTAAAAGQYRDAKQPQKSILTKLEKSRVIQSFSVKIEKMDSDDTAAKKKETDLPKRKIGSHATVAESKPDAVAATGRGHAFRERWLPHKGHGSCRNAACIFGLRGGVAPAGPAGLCDLCNFADMETLMQHGKGRLTHLLNQLAAPEAGIALARIEDAMGEDFANQLRARMQRSYNRKRADRPRRGPRGPYKKK